MRIEQAERATYGREMPVLYFGASPQCSERSVRWAGVFPECTTRQGAAQAFDRSPAHERSEIKFPGFSPERGRRFLPRSALRPRMAVCQTLNR
jgi:hypothetical protein